MVLTRHCLSLILRVGEYEVIEGLDLAVQVTLPKTSARTFHLAVDVQERAGHNLHQAPPGLWGGRQEAGHCSQLKVRGLGMIGSKVAAIVPDLADFA